ncbi:PREDICTED: uncharacterized protein LOC109474261 [Branchiostoma belcheri]|uniref:Uncharacterized protein LOC109474261 n=1 Tax=Branchiostoma belcheri TaxID=7741 RepID=A0A6P4Z871_BRABE|nr:PREDICTED: uncharacterized protein LOC109474261 [Branchiostoma belcheri]
MDEPTGHVNSSQQWPVIVNASLQNSDVTRLLQQQQHKTRVSDTTLRHTCIFPQSGVAFMIIPLNESLTEWPPGGDSVLDSSLVDRFMDRKLYLLPAHNASECVQSMTTIAKATYKPSCEMIRHRLCKLLANQVSDDIVLQIISRLGLSQHECLVLQQGLGTMGRVALASREELLDCSLDSETVNRVIKFFEKDCVVI